MRFGLVLSGVACMITARPALAEQITGAGSTFAAPLYQGWGEQAEAATGLKLNYQAIGSGAGQKLIFQRTVDFGASDAPVAADKLAQNHLLQFPSAIGAEDVVVNIPGIEAQQLKLTGAIVAGIYLGKITSWHDAAIVALNPGLTLPDLPIAPVYRADGSGTTFVFTSYLSKVSAEFKSTVGAATAVSWPAGTGAKGNAGVAGTVQHTAGAIGYVEDAYAEQNHLTTTQLRNHDGHFVKPVAASFTQAASQADWRGAKNFAVDLNDTAGSDSWPIMSATFVLLPTDSATAARSAAVVKFFSWGFANGDAQAASLHYISLPDAVKADVRAAWAAAAAGK